MKNVLCVVAHADDEILGCGGTLAKHATAGDLVRIVIFAGTGSSPGMRTGAQVAKAEAAGNVIGASIITVLNFEDQKFDTYPFLDLVQSLEAEIKDAEIVYTHHAGDLNLDHRIVHQAVLTACRPLPGATVKEIYGMEVVSSTEWRTVFDPTHFVDISEHFETKDRALRFYDDEMRPSPHARSYRRLRALADWRGGQAGVHQAEAFTTIRTVS